MTVQERGDGARARLLLEGLLFAVALALAVSSPLRDCREGLRQSLRSEIAISGVAYLYNTFDGIIWIGLHCFVSSVMNK